MNRAIVPAAIVAGSRVSELPASLYVPPDALRVALANFEGPLDFLHYLIRREDMDIRDIPMAELTKQYLRYVDEVIERQLELAADYLLMSATLIEIKSRMLMPRPQATDAEPEDPRAELVQRLTAYAKIRAAAQHLLKCPMLNREYFGINLATSKRTAVKPQISANLLQLAMLGIKDRQAAGATLSYAAETMTVREAMARVFLRLRTTGAWLFSKLIAGKSKVTKLQAATYFLGILQMCKEQIVSIRQRSADDFQVMVRDVKEREE